MVIEISLKQLAAARLGCTEQEILGFRELPDGGVIVIAPSGQKFKFSLEQLKETANKTMERIKNETIPIQADHKVTRRRKKSDDNRSSVVKVPKKSKPTR